MEEARGGLNEFGGHFGQLGGVRLRNKSAAGACPGGGWDEARAGIGVERARTGDGKGKEPGSRQGERKRGVKANTKGRFQLGRGNLSRRQPSCP